MGLPRTCGARGWICGPRTLRSVVGLVACVERWRHSFSLRLARYVAVRGARVVSRGLAPRRGDVLPRRLLVRGGAGAAVALLGGPPRRYRRVCWRHGPSPCVLTPPCAAAAFVCSRLFVPSTSCAGPTWLPVCPPIPSPRPPSCSPLRPPGWTASTWCLAASPTAWTCWTRLRRSRPVRPTARWRRSS